MELADDGQALSGEYGFEVHEPEGAVVHSYTGAIEGARIGIVPMARRALDPGCVRTTDVPVVLSSRQCGSMSTSVISSSS